MQSRFEIRRQSAVPIEIMTARSDLPMGFMTWDLSPRGAFVITDAVPELGTEVICSFNIPGLQQDYCFFGQISRINRKRRFGDMGPPGFGIDFMDTTPFERLSIRSALAQYPTVTAGPKRGRRPEDLRWPHGYTRRLGRVVGDRRDEQEI